MAGGKAAAWEEGDTEGNSVPTARSPPSLRREEPFAYKNSEHTEGERREKKEPIKA